MTPDMLEKLEIENMKIERFFTKEGKNPYEWDIFGNPLRWVAEEVNVTDDAGKLVFIQPNVKRPESWSALAAKVVASRFFWGDQAKGERENSIEQLVGRVARYFGRQALKQGYFDEAQSKILKEEVEALCTNQLAAFNSPVWFNAGIWEYDKNAGGVSAYRWDANSRRIIKAQKSDDNPQCSACFIQSVEDNMESILSLQVSEAILFKAGSGTGTNRSTLRSSKEKLTGGGRASGPVSFLKGFDAYAGIIKSGGKTRRAAKMEILNIDHPDIVEFIEAKQKEEKKAWALIEAGYDGGINGDAYATVAFQNCNMSVRVTDDFMESVKKNGDWSTRFVKGREVCETFKARELLKKISESTHLCGDPGVQYDTTFNKWHTCKNSGRINATNPCVTGDTKVLLKDGRWTRIDSILNKETKILVNTGEIGESIINGSFRTGNKPIYKLTTKSGYELKLTADHRVFTVNRGFIPACELTKDDFILIPGNQVSPINELSEKDKTFYQILGLYLGDGCSSMHGEKNRQITLAMNKEEESEILQKIADSVAVDYERITHKTCPAVVTASKTTCRYVITNNSLVEKIGQLMDLTKYSHEKCLSEQIFNLTLGEQKFVLQGLFTADGTVANYGEKSQYVALDSTSLQLIKDVQLLLLGFGIKSKLYQNRRAGKTKTMLPDGKGGMKEYDVKEVHSLRISRSSRIKFEKLIGFMPESLKSRRLNILNKNVEAYKDLPIDAVESLNYLGMEEVYDLTEPLTHSFVANGITVHNCSEYAFVDDSACNLASLNLLKFRTEEGGFDVERFKKAIRVFITCMELEIDGASYPTEKIAFNSHEFRPLGLGYANIGALLMSYGLAYDSDEGRSVAAAITAIMTGEAYKTSAELASLVGPFSSYEKNKDCMIDVIKMHRESVKKIDVSKMPAALRGLATDAWESWSDALELGEKFGYRNAQVTVLAPTGTIAFLMDCDTTGIEPDIALVKYKMLAGGGMLKIVNRSVPAALRTLGYSEDKIQKVLDYVDKNETIEGSPDIKEEHLKIFDCAFKPAKGKRSIHYLGHVKMMAAVQPFISGAISKTINMPENATLSDIEEAYIYGWEVGLKALAIYRENSKRAQPLNTKKSKEEVKKVEKIIGERVRMPQTRKSIVHKFDIAGHEGFIIVGLYDNGKPGEVFISMHKQGSTIRGIMDAWATSLSLNLQYGASVNDLFNKFIHSKFEPAGFVRNMQGGDLDKKIKQIKTCSSIVDYVAQFMLTNFGAGAGGIEVDLKTPSAEIEGQLSITDFHKKEEEGESKIDFGNEGLICPHCGGPAKRIGNCAIFCTSCKQTTRRGCGE